MSYGSHIQTSQLIELLDLQMSQSGLPPLCVWGKHGIGKTEIVRDYARENGLEFHYLAPAQFEELGDLLGMPAIEGKHTSLRPPAWVPVSEKPGILLLDDLNRADDRILRGLMPLLQGYGMVSWNLPPSWRIICTANPDDGSYAVSPLDPAILTRLMHVQLQFHPDDWAIWANKMEINPREIAFLRLHTEQLTNERSTPRTLSQFFLALKSLSGELDRPAKWRLLAESFTDPKTAEAYLQFRERWEIQWIDPLEYLSGKSPQDRLVDLLQAGPRWQKEFGEALLRVLENNEQRITAALRDRLLAFIQSEHLRPSYRLQFGRDLAAIQKPGIQNLLSDPEMAVLLLG